MAITTHRQDFQDRTSSAEVPLNLPDAAHLAASLHGSLLLAEILRGCRRFLQAHFRLGRLSFMQLRANQSTATLYALEGETDAPLIGPRVIVLGPSRLKHCIAERRICVVRISAKADQDPIEKKYLLHSQSGFAVYAPLQLCGKLKGVLVLDLPRNIELTATQRALISYVSGHLALAIQNSDRHYMECRRSRQLEMVSEISRRAVRVESLVIFLDQAVQLIRSCFDYRAVQVWTSGGQPGEMALRAAALKSSDSHQGDAALPWMVGECERLNQTLCSNEVSAEGRGDARRASPPSQLAVPIRIRGKMLGVLYLESSRLDAFPVEDLSTMEGVASLIASTYDNLRAFEHAQQSNEYMQAILESAKDLAVLSTDTRGLVITSSVGAEPILHMSAKQILGSSILNLFCDAHFRKELDVYVHSSDQLILERKRLYQPYDGATSYLDVSVQRVYDPDKRAVGFLCIVQDVTENVRLQERLEALSITDELTGFFNRRRFFATISQELERGRRFNRRLSLCFFDLDGFKQYNDLNGHRKGDLVLKETAQLVSPLVRFGVDSCYRYGGDEFIIVMPETVKANARLVAERIREQLKRRFRGEITASIGIAESGPRMSAERLLERADKAMYRAKSQGGDQTVLAD